MKARISHMGPKPEDQAHEGGVTLGRNDDETCVAHLLANWETVMVRRGDESIHYSRQDEGVEA